jgi:hypothetical protein
MLEEAWFREEVRILSTAKKKRHRRGESKMRWGWGHGRVMPLVLIPKRCSEA